MAAPDLSGFPEDAPSPPSRSLRFVDVGVTATAKEFQGIYRGKQQHPADFSSVADRAKQAGVEKVLLTGMSTLDIGINRDTALERNATSKKPAYHLTAGVHPYHANELATDPERSRSLERLSQEINISFSTSMPLIVAFGEIGLDFDRTEYASREVQIEAFRLQLDLLVDKHWNLPLFLHCRAAFDSFVEVIEPYIPKLPRRGVVHSFVGTKEQMHRLLDLGLDISVNGFSFKTTESLEMVAAVPLDRLHLETDAPWGEIKSTFEVSVRYCKHAPEAPASKKKDKWDAAFMVKERNESCMISRVAFVVAGLKGISVEEVAEAAWRNSVKLYQLA